jgi:hypothetical protein
MGVQDQYISDEKNIFQRVDLMVVMEEKEVI